MPKPSLCIGCPLYEKGRGFCLDSGDPKKAKLGLLLEAPGTTEIEHRTSPEEIALRTRDYPRELEPFFDKGMPIVGMSGKELEMWVFRSLGIHRDDFFIGNTLRCLPPKGKNNEPYPVGDERKAAEAHCRVYDRWSQYNPSVAIISLHPAAILRDTTPLPLQIADFRKALEFRSQGERPLILSGGKAAELWLKRSGINVLRLRGSYEFVKPSIPIENVKVIEAPPPEHIPGTIERRDVSREELEKKYPK